VECRVIPRIEEDQYFILKAKSGWVIWLTGVALNQTLHPVYWEVCQPWRGIKHGTHEASSSLWVTNQLLVDYLDNREKCRREINQLESFQLLIGNIFRFLYSSAWINWIVDIWGHLVGLLATLINTFHHILTCWRTKSWLVHQGNDRNMNWLWKYYIVAAQISFRLWEIYSVVVFHVNGSLVWMSKTLSQSFC